MVCSCSSPTTPSPTQVAGVWAQTLRVTASTGGECLAASLRDSVGESSNRTLTVAQSGSSLTATSPAGPDVCSWTGTVASDRVLLNFARCGGSPDFVGLRCDDGSGIRDLRQVSDVIDVTVVGNTATGTETVTFNIQVSGTQNSVGTWTETWAVSMTR